MTVKRRWKISYVSPGKISNASCWGEASEQHGARGEKCAGSRVQLFPAAAASGRRKDGRSQYGRTGAGRQARPRGKACAGRPLTAAPCSRRGSAPRCQPSARRGRGEALGPAQAPRAERRGAASPRARRCGPVGAGRLCCRQASARGAHYLASDRRTAAAPLPATRCLRAADIERAAAMTLAAAAGGRRRRWAKPPPPRQETRRRERRRGQGACGKAGCDGRCRAAMARAAGKGRRGGVERLLRRRHLQRASMGLRTSAPRAALLCLGCSRSWGCWAPGGCSDVTASCQTQRRSSPNSSLPIKAGSRCGRPPLWCPNGCGPASCTSAWICPSCGSGNFGAALSHSISQSKWHAPYNQSWALVYLLACYGICLILLTKLRSCSWFTRVNKHLTRTVLRGALLWF